MELSQHLNLSYYKTVATINEEHKVFVVQHQTTKQLYVKKELDIFNINVYRTLINNPIIGIPKIIDYFETDNSLIVIEEYISGTPLSSLIHNHTLTEQTCVDYITSLCNTTKMLHNLNPPIIHRDIKPSNIIVTNSNTPILLDFNAAKLFSPNNDEDTILLGTKGYAAPEQYGFGSSSPQTDIYALGIVLKEMLASCTSYNLAINTIIEKCTKLTPTERYASISDFENDLIMFQNKSKYSFCQHNYLPPGYRSKTPWKIIIASITYLFIGWLCFSLEVKNTYGIALWIERIFCLLIFISIILVSFNYQNIHSYFPLCRSENIIVKIIGVVILDIAITFLLMLILLILETSFFSL